MNNENNKSILFINLGNFGSTGSIISEISRLANSFGFRPFKAYPVTINNKPTQINDIIIINRIFLRFSKYLSYVTGLNGYFGVLSSALFIKKINHIKPIIIHFHNLHNSYINLPLIFKYVKNRKIPVVWTLHDCWSFTGRCPHYGITKCNKWITGCYDCPYPLNLYPATHRDRSRTMWRLKKKWFTGVQNMTIVTPSKWLAEQVKQSFLKDYSVKVINNGIDLSIFKPTPSDFCVNNNICINKFILLGVSFGWGCSKGLDVFIELAKRLDPNIFQIVLVGTDDKIDSQLSESIISINRTNSQHELAGIYTAADLFVNPTREEVLGMVNLEALACGTPGITFRTGGSPECYDDTCGVVVDCDDIDAMEREIIRIYETRPFSSEDCINRAKKFDMNDKYNEYIDLYNKICK